jgi:hypothetical protein
VEAVGSNLEKRPKLWTKYKRHKDIDYTYIHEKGNDTRGDHWGMGGWNTHNVKMLDDYVRWIITPRDTKRRCRMDGLCGARGAYHDMERKGKGH